MKLTPHNHSHRRVRRTLAFTMVEVALSLAIIAFAVVAVIGILPTGMQVQRDNREMTIINQDGQFILGSNGALTTGWDIDVTARYAITAGPTGESRYVQGAPQTPFGSNCVTCNSRASTMC